MAVYHGQLTALLVLVLVFTVSCSQHRSSEDVQGDTYEGLTDRDIILTLVNRIEDLEHWKTEQQKESTELRSRLQQQNRQLERMRLLLRGNRLESEPTIQTQGHSTDDEKHAEIGKEKQKQIDKRNNARTRQIVDKGAKTNGYLMFENVKDRRHAKQRRRQLESSMRAAFFATASGQLTNLGNSQILEFDNVTTNVGHAYSPHTGAFTAPYDGTYVFSVSLMGQTRHETHYFVSKNGAEVSRLYIHGSESPYTTTSHTVVVQLQQGDDVEVRNTDAGEGIYGDRYSCFSGFLLYFDEPTNNQIIG